MQAKIHAELKCEKCNGQLVYHKDEFVKCNTLKCEMRGKLFHGPVIELKPVEADKAKKGKK